MSEVGEFETDKVWELKKELEKYGYLLDKVTHFPKHDRLHLRTKDYKISINLRGHLRDFPLKSLVQICIAKETTKQ
jgi:hypothetical protein